MDFDQSSRRPFTFEQARHHVVNTTEHDHGEKSVNAMVSVAHGEVREVGDLINRPQSHGRADQADQRVRDRTEDDETKCWTAPNFLMQANH